MEFINVFKGKEKDFSDFFENYKVVQVLNNDVNGEIENFYKNLAATCGIPLIHDEDPISGKLLVGNWSTIEYDSNKQNVYKHSNTSQPLHTDYSYFSFDIFAAFIFCITQAEIGGATHFVDVDDIVKVLKTTNKRLFDDLLVTEIQFGRVGNPISNRKDLILQQDDIGWKINWNYYRAISDLKNKELIDEFKLFLDTHIENSVYIKKIVLNPGDAVFFHDRRVLHGRSSFVGYRKLNKAGIAKNIPSFVHELINAESIKK